jgi:hypothetical protein
MENRRLRMLVLGLGLFVACGAERAANAASTCDFACADLNGDQITDSTDFVLLQACLGEPPISSNGCSCADLDGNLAVDLADFALFTLLFAGVSDELPPGCTGAPGTMADLTAYRPRHGNGYFPFARTAVPDAWEENTGLGPGIRINAPGDSDPGGEDDLVEVVLSFDPPGAALALRRGDGALRVWTTPDRQPGSEIAFSGDKTGILPIGPSATALTVWVEWSAATHGTADLTLEPASSSVVKDRLTFHTFRAIVVALGGENQSTSVPVDPNHGSFVVGTALYQLGYDVHMFDEDNVSATGAGAVYDTVADAVQQRMVDQVAIFGYSHGGGSTYDLADRLDVNRAGLGIFTIGYTAYVDSVSNNSDIDTGQELRRPPSTAHHVNHYQRGSFFEDLGLDGGPVPNSVPPPTGLDVETTPWGAGADHFEVDDFVEVRSLMESELIARIPR